MKISIVSAISVIISIKAIGKHYNTLLNKPPEILPREKLKKTRWENHLFISPFTNYLYPLDFHQLPAHITLPRHTR